MSPLLSVLNAESAAGPKLYDYWSFEQTYIHFRSSRIQKPVRILFITDTHLALDDERGAAYTQYSGRMAKAYIDTSDYLTGAKTTPEESFINLLGKLDQYRPDVILLLGDMINFPSAAGVEWLCRNLNKTSIPWYYISGNHDWHYEGLPGTEIALRNEWTSSVLAPLYRNLDPLCYAVNINGLYIVMIDDSVYEILPKQLEFLRRQIQTNKPFILCMHIPLYAPNRPVGYGCGHPDWNAQNDSNYQIERRPQWPESGHTSVTFSFWNEVFAAQNLLGIFAGHIHSASIDTINNIPQFVVPTNSNGNFRLAAFLPEGE